MSDSNRTRLSYIKEVTYGTTPAGNLIDMRFTSESLMQESNFIESEEIRSDRQTADVIRVMIRATGATPWEFSPSATPATGYPDDLLQAALLSAGWSSVVTQTATTFAATNTNTFTRSAGSFITDGYTVGSWVKVSGFANAANNGYFKVTNVAATILTVVGASATATEAAGPSVTIAQLRSITNGVATASFTIERNFTDLTNEFQNYKGMMIDQMEERVTSDQIITGSFTWIGQREVSTTSSVGSGYTAATTTEIYEAVDHIHNILEGNTAPNGNVGIELTWQLSNNLRGRTQIGTLGVVSVGTGSVNVQGTYRQYFTSKTLADKYRNNTASSLAYIKKDSAGANEYIVEFPRIKYTSGKHNAGGKDQDVIMDLSFRAYRHPTEGVTIRISRI